VPKARRFVWAALAVAAWGTAYIVFGAGGMAGVFRARAEATRLQQQLVQARQANRALEREIDQLRSDPGAIERIAREDLYLAKPGETVYLLPPLPEREFPTPDGSGQPLAVSPPDSPPQQ